VQSDENGHVILCAFEKIGEVTSGLTAKLGEAETVKAVWKPQTVTPVDEETAQSLMRLIYSLDEDDDVQNVFTNFEISDEVMKKLTAA
jgi:transcriptional/translational regulatory protein YebC/TACO1